MQQITYDPRLLPPTTKIPQQIIMVTTLKLVDNNDGSSFEISQQQLCKPTIVMATTLWINNSDNNNFTNHIMLQIGEITKAMANIIEFNHNSQLKTQVGLKHKQGCKHTKKTKKT